MAGPAPAAVHMVAGAQSAEQFSQQLAKATGLSVDVVRAWVRAEGAYAPNGTGHFNFLNLRTGPGGHGYSGVKEGSSPKGFAQFGSLGDSVKETARWINGMSNYKGIHASAGKADAVQLAAIARSKWDSSHYANGANLTKNYKKGAAIEPWANATVNPIKIAADAGVPNVGDLFGGIGTWVAKLVFAAVVALLAFALIYEGVRRTSGDRLPSGEDMATRL